MKFQAKILEAGGQDFTIFGESLSFYVEKALESAGVEVVLNEADDDTDYVLIAPDCIPLIKSSVIKKIIKNVADMDDEFEYIIPGEECVILTLKAAFYNNLPNITSYAEFRNNLKSSPSGGKFKIKDRIDSYEALSGAIEAIKKRINKRHMKNGVTLIDKAAAYIGPHVKIGAGSIIMPGVIIEGDTIIGRNCTIGPNTRLINMKIESECEITYSVACDSTIGKKTKVGPFAYIRPRCDIGCSVKIGDFVEVKNAVIKDNAKASHLAYIGDADVGENVNIGCGVITANYDGKNKSRTVIKNGVFVGSNSNLIAPVVIEENAFIAAGSTITNDVPGDTLAIARAKQEVKPDWKRPS